MSLRWLPRHFGIVSAGTRYLSTFDNIPFGNDFRDHINDAIGRCNVLLVLIGDDWNAPTAEGGQRRLDIPTDFVRLELETALAKKIPVVPVLVGAAKMPPQSALPISLQVLAYRNAAEIRAGRDRQHHLEVLVQGLEDLLRPPPSGGGGVAPPSDTDGVQEKLNTASSDEAVPEYGRALLLSLVGFGLAYAAPELRRRWLYMVLCVGSIVVAIVTMGLGVGPLLLVWLVSAVDVVVTVAKKRRARQEAHAFRY